MANTRPTDESFIGSFTSETELTSRYPAVTSSGRQASVTIGGYEAPYVCDGSAWRPLASLATDPSGNVTGLVGPGGNVNSVFGITNKMRKWQGAIGKMRNGVRNAKLLMLGDSTMVGAGGTGAVGYQANGRLKSQPTFLSAELNRTYYPANNHSIWGNGNMSSSTVALCSKR